jgi:CBS domain-containing protein
MPEETAVSSLELERIERFIAAYNRIDDVLQREMGAPQTFRSAVDGFAKRYPWWRDAEALRVFAALRNFLVHEKVLPFDYPCVPGEAATREIEAIGARLTNPITIGEKFGREVLTLAPHAPLKAALELISRRGISRFPIYDGARFVGLLTENGIARFVAQIVADGAKFQAQTPIQAVLPRETKRRNFRFASMDTPVAQAGFLFHEETFLEAILITQSGEQSASLQGIVTRGDVAGWVG